jgi:hypothetical protein
LPQEAGPDQEQPERLDDEGLQNFLLVLYPALQLCVEFIEERWGRRADYRGSQLRDFLLVVRRAMLLVTNWIAARYGL